MGLKAYQEYRVINLWELDVNLVFQTPLPSLLPFVPILQGGNDEAIIRQKILKFWLMLDYSRLTF